MKTILKSIFTFILIFNSLGLLSQENCRVLKPSLAGSYEGKCKNGLANGKGIAVGIDKYEGQFSKGLPHGEGKYTWENGSYYIGKWAEGNRQGIGKYVSTNSGIDSIQDGVWLDDKYVGPKPSQPEIMLSSGVDRYNFKKNKSPLNRVLIDFYQNGVRNNKITNLSMRSSNGQDISYGYTMGYDNVTFPVTINISYTTPSKLGAATCQARFDFVIFEPGDWTVELHN